MTKTPKQLDAEINVAIANERGSPGFSPFRSWPEVVRAVESGEKIFYWAALDSRPRRVMAVKIFRNGKIRIDPLSNQVDKFNIDNKHLGLLYKKD